MSRHLSKALWAFRTFRNPLTFLSSLYRGASGNTLLRFRDGLDIEVRRNRWDSAIVMEMFYDCPYIRDVEIGRESTVVDIGSYIGDFAIYAGKVLGARVIAFEPSADNWALARRNIDRNRLADRVALNQLAVGGTAPVTLYVKRDGNEIHVAADPMEGAVAESIPSVTLAQALAMAGGAIDLLKIDCEGFEYDILDGAPAEAFAPVRAVAMEYHHVSGWRERLPKLKAKLAAAGFQVVDSAPYIFARRPLAG